MMLGKSFDGTSPLFLQIKERIEDQIISGGLKSDEQIPSTTQIVQFYKINHITVSKGVNLLVDEGVLYKKRGLGIFVSQNGRDLLIEKRQAHFVSQFLQPMLLEAKKLDIDLNRLMAMMKEEC